MQAERSQENRTPQERKTEKLPYERPSLVEFGRLSEITLANGGNANDGIGTLSTAP